MKWPPGSFVTRIYVYVALVQAMMIYAISYMKPLLCIGCDFLSWADIDIVFCETYGVNRFFIWTPELSWRPDALDLSHSIVWNTSPVELDLAKSIHNFNY